MTGTIRGRFIGFILAICLVSGLLGWAAHSSWKRGGELAEKLSSLELQSFQIASHLQQTILELDNLVLRYGAYQKPADWARFEQTSTNLDRWIDLQRPSLASDAERRLLDAINTNYDRYLAAASQIRAQAASRQAPSADLNEFADFEAQSQNILKLGSELTKARLESMDAFFKSSKRTLGYLRLVLLNSLILLLLAGLGLAVLVYRDLIAPLRVKLVEREALIERQEKLASLGMLAAGVAHEIRNPLTAIKAWLFIQQKHLSPGTPEYADADIIGNEIVRLERIVKEVLLFARPSEPQFAVVAAQEPLRQVEVLLKPQLEAAGIRLELSPANEEARVKIDPQQFQQVLINLVQNGADSVSKNGTVKIGYRIEVKKLLDQTAEVVIFDVSDTGKGIPPEVERRLFDPFFTTKEAGTGLGLSIAARIIEKHGGLIQYQTQLNRGTTFGIVLPRV
jgi:signal transduction histidine kinase